MIYLMNNHPCICNDVLYNISVIPGTGNPNYMKENLDIYNFELSENEMNQINSLRYEKDISSKFFIMKPID